MLVVGEVMKVDSLEMGIGTEDLALCGREMIADCIRNEGRRSNYSSLERSDNEG